MKSKTKFGKDDEKPKVTKPGGETHSENRSEEESEFLHSFREIAAQNGIIDDSSSPDGENRGGKNHNGENPVSAYSAETKSSRKSVSEDSPKEKLFGEKRRPGSANGGIPDYEELFRGSGSKSGGGKILLQLLRDNSKSALLSSFLYIVKAISVWVTPVVTANIINLATHPSEKSSRLIVINALIALFCIVQNIPSHILYSRFTDKMLRRIGAGLRNTLIRKLQHLSITYHKEMETGRVQAKFLRDIEAIEFFNTQFIKAVIPALIQVIVSMSIATAKSRTVAAFFVFIVPLNVSVVWAFRKKMSGNNRIFRKETENISSKVSSMLDMLPVTKAHGLEEEEIVSVERQIKTLYEKGINLDKTNAYFGSISWVVAQSVSLLCLAFTSYLALRGKIPVGDIIMYQSFFGTISGNVQSLTNIYPELSKGLESVRSVSEIMLSDEVEDNRNKIKLRYVHGTVDFENVTYRYPHTDKDIIKNFSLHVSKGECIAFVGASGSGKSTVMNMIIGFLRPTSGRLLIDGKPIDALNLSDYRHFISVVPQNSILFDGTIKENILYGAENITDERLEEVLKEANINEFLGSLPNGIDTRVGENGSKLSGGQKQRISIARALIRDPKILILDEATSALDNISEYQVQKAISHLIRERTTFIVAHRLSTIRDANRIVVMENGECVETGTYEELMAKKGKFFELKSLSDMNA